MNYKIDNIKNTGESKYTDMKNRTHNVTHYVINPEYNSKSREKIIDELFNVFTPRQIKGGIRRSN